MAGIAYIGLEIGLHGVDLPPMDSDLEYRLKEAIRGAFPTHFEHESDITVDFVESAGG